MTVEVFAGHEYVPLNCKIVFEIEELRDGEWVVVERAVRYEGSAFKRNIWLGRRLVISERPIAEESEGVA